MEAIVFIGIQASGKSTFYKERLADTHVRINLDMLKTRARERILLAACFNAKQPFAVDNTNPTRAERAAYIQLAREHSFKIIGYFFQSRIEECKQRNEIRPEASKIPLPGLLGTHARLELPRLNEGFDELYFVRMDTQGFVVEKWNDEV